MANVTGSWFVSRDSYVEARYVHLTEDDTQQARTILTAQPRTIDPLRLGDYGATVDAARSDGNSGVAEFADLGDSYRRDEVRLTASRFLELGPTQHQMKLGGGFETDTYDLVRSTNGWGSLIVSSAAEIRARYYTRQPRQTGKARTYSAFVQDSCTWGRLTATLGVLVNRDEFAQIALDGTRINFLTFGWVSEIQPRAGLAYGVGLVT
ncbi:MAG: hypothetical protein ABIT01_09350, partial [Thermoanaerobaculia bacterium]